MARVFSSSSARKGAATSRWTYTREGHVARLVLAIDERNRRLDSAFHLAAWIERDAFVDLVVRAMASDLPSDADVADQLVAEIYDHIVWQRRLGPDRMLVDKTPWHLRHARRILRRFPDAKVVEVLRDGRRRACRPATRSVDAGRACARLPSRRNAEAV